MSTSRPAPVDLVNVYPNPAHTRARVQMPPLLGVNQVAFTLTDVLGRVVRTCRANLLPTDLIYELDVVGLVPGVYGLRMEAGTTMAVGHLAVE